MNARSARRNLVSGGIGLALVALWATAPTPLGAIQVQELPKEKKRAAGEPTRPVAPSASQPQGNRSGQANPGQASQGSQAPAPRPAQANPAPVVRPGQPAQANPAPVVRPGQPAQANPAPVVRPGQPAQANPAPVSRPGQPAQANPSAPGPRPGQGSPSGQANQAPASRPGPAQVNRPGPGTPATSGRTGPSGGDSTPGSSPAAIPPSHSNHTVPEPLGRPSGPTQGPATRPAGVAGAAPMRGRDPRPLTVVRTPDGGEVHRTPAGAVREVRTPAGAVIHYAPDGMRHVEVARPDGRVVFANGNGHGGYVQRPFRVQNQSFVQRTYVERGVTYTRVYRPYVSRGITFNVYMPSHYYRPAFYSWTYRSWGEPVHYRWDWGQRPWYGYYRGYYSPFPYYTSPIFWLTDFMVAATLETAYQARLDDAVAPPPAYDGYGMTPEVKQAIADEVRRQVDQERAEQQSAGLSYDQAGMPPPLFADNVSRIFLVASGTVAYADGQEYYLSAGDVLQLNGAPAPSATYADVVLLASRERNLPRGSVVSVSLLDLQEMQNRMRANIDQGLGDLQTNQGRDGLPALPPQTLGASDAAYARAVQPDNNAAGELSQVAQDADGSSQQAPAQVAPDSSRSVSVGMTPAEVRAILGAPRQTAVIGNKRIEVYQDFKITYRNNSVTDIQ